MLTVHQIINKPVPSNCFVLYDKAIGRECIVVDPGSKSDDDLFAYFEEEGLVPQYIVLTHEHFDHCWGVNELVEKYQIPIVCSALCAECIQFEKRNCSVFYDNNERFVITSRSISIESLNCVLPFFNTELRFYSLPGHTDAGICFAVGNYLFTGDTLIKDVPTVVKLPTGSIDKLKVSYELFIQHQGEHYVIYPGHGCVFKLDEYNLIKMFKR